LPPTWTPTSTATIIPTFTEAATFTPVPAFTQPARPTNDSLGDLVERYQQSIFSPNGQWAAYREPNKIRVENAEEKREWTLPCELFDECSVLFPLKWSRNGRILYFAPAPANSGSPANITLFTALAQIDVRSGKWELLLPDSDRYYDFTFSPDDKYLAYTQSSGNLPGEASVTMGIMGTESKKGQQFTLDGVYAGNIVWSPFKYRFIFQTIDPDKGSSIVYFDLETNLLKYVLKDEQSDFSIGLWNDADNLVALRQTDWVTRSSSNWMLNPFTAELEQATPIP
jgi:WD40 repeat protein